jgi:anthranilate phosphoribosyltransferase
LGRFNQLRRSLGQRTLFNFMGPLLNPFLPDYRLLGVSDLKLHAVLAKVLAQEPTLNKAWVVSGHPHENRATLDELTCHGRATVTEVQRGQLQSRLFHCQFAGDPPAWEARLTIADNLAIWENLIAGVDSQSYFYRTVCLNAGAALLVAGRVATLLDGVAQAEALLAEGAVAEQARRTIQAAQAAAGGA